MRRQDALQTPEDRFQALPGYAYEPHSVSQSSAWMKPMARRRFSREWSPIPSPWRASDKCDRGQRNDFVREQTAARYPAMEAA